jgi:hypothetical protein
MGQVVRRSVSAVNPETGETRWFHAGDEVDADWAEYITNPKVFEDPEDEVTPEGANKRSLGVPEQNSPDPGGAEDADEIEGPTPGHKFGEDEGETGAPDYESMNKSELEDLLVDRELSHTGTKPELIERLKAHDAANG